MKKYVIIVAGGSGKRMNTKTPKQFLLLNGKPVLMHTIQRFVEYEPLISIILVLPKVYFQTWNSLCEKHKFQVPMYLVEGGEQRFHSVQNGLATIDGGLVAIHDGVRPLVSKKTIGETFEAAEKFGAAVPVVPIVQSLRKISKASNQAVNRQDYVAVQTPQCFKISLIKQAFQQEYQSNFTDDASVYEAQGGTIHLTGGDKTNIKITTPEDLDMVEYLLNNSKLPKIC